MVAIALDAFSKSSMLISSKRKQLKVFVLPFIIPNGMKNLLWDCNHASFIMAAYLSICTKPSPPGSPKPSNDVH